LRLLPGKRKKWRTSVLEEKNRGVKKREDPLPIAQWRKRKKKKKDVSSVLEYGRECREKREPHRKKPAIFSPREKKGEKGNTRYPQKKKREIDGSFELVEKKEKGGGERGICICPKRPRRGKPTLPFFLRERKKRGGSLIFPLFWEEEKENFPKSFISALQGKKGERRNV